MSLDLKHIPCPAGNSCTAFKCIFGHQRDIKVPSVTSPQVNDAQQFKAGKDNGPPKKRVKVDDAPSANKDHKPTADVDALTGSVRTATKQVSPPPLKRPSTVSKANQGSEGSLTKASTGAKAASKSTPVKPRKIETLNPRLLKSSPASHETRTKLLRLLHAEYTRLNKELKKDASTSEEELVLSDQDTIFKSLDDEEKTALEKPSVYSNVMKNMVMQYKRMNTAQWKDERKQAIAKLAPKDSDGASAPKNIETGLPPALEVQILRRLLTPIQNLANHGYVPSVPPPEDVQKAKDGQETANGWEQCDRCKQRFQVFPGRRGEDGALTSGGMCRYHWGKQYVPLKHPGDRSRREKRWKCCTEEVGESAGCHTEDFHVFKASKANMLAAVMNFKETPPNPSAPADRAVAFDCEMGYTVHGLELIRLTAVSWPAGQVLLDVLVRPIGEILDLNSRFSGVWPDDMARATPWNESYPPPSAPEHAVSEDWGSEDGQVAKKVLPIVPSPEAARTLLFSLLAPSTPLIGHGLENDLNATRIIHPALVDTILLYPHKAGLPARMGLKHLMSYHLNRQIQQETGPKMLGHDSAEDARAAGDLAKLRVMEEWGKMQRMGWKVVEGELIQPES